MGLYSYTNEKNKYPMCHEYKKEESYPKDYERYSGEAEYHKEEEAKGYECKKDDCDSESARALKKIIALLDDLNNEDLKILEELVERLLCSRAKVW